MKKNKNVYMGSDSTARLPVFGRVDTGNEILLNAFATGYDSLNGRMLTKTFGVFDKSIPREINGRFGILRMLCRRHAPSKLGIVNRIYDISIGFHNGKYSYNAAISMLNDLSMKNNPGVDFFSIAVSHVDRAENNGFFEPFGVNMFYFIDDKRRKK